MPAPNESNFQHPKLRLKSQGKIVIIDMSVRFMRALSVNSNHFISFCHKQAVKVLYPGEICPTHVTSNFQQEV